MIAAPLLCLAAVAQPDGRADAVADRLAAAVDAYDADRAAARADLRAGLAEARDDAQEGGDGAALGLANAALAAFDAGGAAPAAAPDQDRRRYAKRLDRADAAVARASRSAVRDYERLGLSKEAADARRALDAVEAAAADRAAAADPRDRFIYERGWFGRVEGDVWEERDVGGADFRFRQVAADRAGVTLDRPYQSKTVRVVLGANSSTMEHVGGPPRPLYDGFWHAPLAGRGVPVEPGDRFVGVKTFGKQTGEVPAGGTEAFELRIDAVLGNAFAGEVIWDGPNGRGTSPVTGRAGGAHLEWQAAGPGAYGLIRGGAIQAVGDGATYTLRKTAR